MIGRAGRRTTTAGRLVDPGSVRQCRWPQLPDRSEPFPSKLRQLRWRYPSRDAGADEMSKGFDRKKETKKKPAMNLMQKRAAKAEKKKNK